MTVNVSAIFVNACMAFIAAGCRFWAARNTFPELRPLSAVTGMLAFVYGCAYVWLGFNIEQSADWSAFMRPIGLVVWPMVWIVPALGTSRVWRKLQRSAQEVVETRCLD